MSFPTFNPFYQTVCLHHPVGKTRDLRRALKRRERQRRSRQIGKLRKSTAELIQGCLRGIPVGPAVSPELIGNSGVYFPPSPLPAPQFHRPPTPYRLEHLPEQHLNSPARSPSSTDMLTCLIEETKAEWEQPNGAIRDFVSSASPRREDQY